MEVQMESKVDSPPESPEGAEEGFTEEQSSEESYLRPHQRPSLCYTSDADGNPPFPVKQVKPPTHHNYISTIITNVLYVHVGANGFKEAEEALYNSKKKEENLLITRILC
jgi:hypothetical protein